MSPGTSVSVGTIISKPSLRTLVVGESTPKGFLRCNKEKHVKNIINQLKKAYGPAEKSDLVDRPGRT